MLYDTGYRLILGVRIGVFAVIEVDHFNSHAEIVYALLPFQLRNALVPCSLCFGDLLNYLSVPPHHIMCRDPGGRAIKWSGGCFSGSPTLSHDDFRVAVYSSRWATLFS